MKFKLLQISLLHLDSNLVNRLGWHDAAEQSPKVAAYVSSRHDQVVVGEHLEHFTHVATIEITGREDIDSAMEAAFHGHNTGGGEGYSIEFHAKQHSMSVGDVLVAEDGSHYIVKGVGFEKL